MRLIILLITVSLLSLSSGVAFEFDRSAEAQTRRRPRRTTIKPPKGPDPAKTQEQAAAKQKQEQLDKLNLEIGKHCAKLENLLHEANGKYAYYPYDELETDGYFVRRCTTDGTIKWTAKRRFGDSEQSKTRYDITVTLKTTELNLGQLSSENGVVYLVSNDSTIYVVGPTAIKMDANLNRTEKEAWLDLREEDEYAIPFKDTLRKLFNDLKTRENI